MKNNMTALVSCFARYYHTVNSNIKIYNDTLAPAILTKLEIENISKNMMKGIKFFNPYYDEDDSLKWVVNNILAPSILARSIFNEKHLLNEIRLGLKQYLILESGYDTSRYKISDKVSVYELDKKEIINQALAKEAGEEMKSKYSYKDIEAIVQASNMLIYEHLNYQDINDTFFYDYNTLNPSNKILAPKRVAYCLLVKQ